MNIVHRKNIMLDTIKLLRTNKMKCFLCKSEMIKKEWSDGTVVWCCTKCSYQERIIKNR